MTATLPARFAAKITDTGSCWLWNGALQTHGYGSASIGDGRTALAHRVIYEMLVGPIPAGLTIDHLCRVKACVNPAHLEPVTSAENSRRAAAMLTHCRYGHPLAGENLYMKRLRGGQMRRVCLTCSRGHQRAYRARLRTARAALATTTQ